MRKYIFAILFTICTLFNFSSCVDIEYPNQYPPVVQIFYGNWTPGTTNAYGQYVIGGYTTGQTRASMTRAAVSQTYDDKFSLWSWTPDSTVMDNFHGVFGTDPNTGNPSWGYTEGVKYFDNFVNQYSFIGVIPQSDSHVYDATNHTVTVVADTFSVSSTDLTYKDDREILYATTTVEKANYINGASLAFNNLNSKIYLQFTSDDANTQILDFTPYTPGIPSKDAWDEDVVTYTYSVTCKPFAAQGPLFSTSAITQEDIDYINSKYSTTGTWSTYYSSSVAVNGPLNEDMWSYLTNKYPTLTSENLNNWTQQVTNTNMKLVHMEIISNSGDNTLDGCIRGWFVNTINMSNTSQEVHTTVHHEAVEGKEATGHKGIIMLPATSANGTGTDAQLSSFPTSVNATISLNGVTWTTNSTGNEITFAKPSGNVYTTAVQCPMTFFTFPTSVANTANLGYTIKFSYTYKNVNVYDARVFIPADKCNWESAKYYVYQIHISDRGNGKADDGDADPTDPTIPTGSTNYQITVNSVSINGYTHGNTWTWDSTNGWVQQ